MKDKKITLLVIDDNQNDREFCKHLLQKNKDIGAILEAETVSDAVALYSKHDIDCNFSYCLTISEWTW